MILRKVSVFNTGARLARNATSGAAKAPSIMISREREIAPAEA